MTKKSVAFCYHTITSSCLENGYYDFKEYNDALKAVLRDVMFDELISSDIITINGSFMQIAAVDREAYSFSAVRNTNETQETFLFVLTNAKQIARIGSAKWEIETEINDDDSVSIVTLKTFKLQPNDLY